LTVLSVVAYSQPPTPVEHSKVTSKPIQSINKLSKNTRRRGFEDKTSTLNKPRRRTPHQHQRLQRQSLDSISTSETL
ncbi:hypothetical protein GIB67_010099, partial [Kingdonia uniflora]